MTSLNLGFDRPLSQDTAIEKDKLGRMGFANAAVNALESVCSTTGFVLSIEGAWGSGKTSTLAMMQALLQKRHPTPIVVHFNPWLVGDRDALLRHFLSKIAAEVKLADRAADGKKVARELQSYAKVFDVIKLIPGAEPWASLVKSVIESAGNTVDSIATYKTPDIEIKKGKVEDALRKYARPIIVFIDDIDRLFPLEVFEMVRIVKAIGDLPNVGYVLAWDPAYVVEALKSASVPRAEHYLDKIVQLRLPLPSIGMAARGVLLDEALSRLQTEAHTSYFQNDEDRLGILYFSGLREILEQPRDIARVFNTVAAIEPPLRGEIVLADIIGFAALMVKAPRVYELIRREPRWFVGLLPGDPGLVKGGADLLKESTDKREATFNACDMPDSVRKMVHRLFPLTAIADDEFTFGNVVDVEGHLASPARLLVALQLHISSTDVSFVMSRRYLLHANQRDEITEKLTSENCMDFLECLGDIASSTLADGIADVEQLCVDIAKLPDTEPFLTKVKNRAGFFQLSAENVALRAIHCVANAVAHSRATSIADRIFSETQALTVAMELFVGSFLREKTSDDGLKTSPDSKGRLAKLLAKNMLDAATRGTLLTTCNPGFLLWNLSRVEADECPKVFSAMRSIDPTLDGFVLAILSHTYDSTKGQQYSLPTDRSKIEAYCSLVDLELQAKERLLDSTLTYPTRAAWRSIVEDRSVYGVDGSYPSR